MSNYTAETTFYHLDDCIQAGCPGHILVGEFNDTSDSLQITVEGMEKHNWSGDIKVFEAMQTVFSALDMENR